MRLLGQIRIVCHTVEVSDILATVLNLDIVARIPCGWTEMSECSCCGCQTERSSNSSCAWPNSTARAGDWLKAVDRSSFPCKRRILCDEQPHENSHPAGQEQQSIQKNPGTEEERKGTIFVTKDGHLFKQQPLEVLLV